MRLAYVLLLTLLAGLPLHTVAGEILPVKSALSPVAEKQIRLTISGKGSTTKLTLPDIEKLPMYQTSIKTQWGMDGTFQGVLMSDLMRAYKLDGNTKHLVFHALDNYVAGLSIAEFKRSPALLATRFNGHPIPLADKGPLILLWPGKEQEVLEGKATLSGWVWSVSEIVAK